MWPHKTILQLRTCRTDFQIQELLRARLEPQLVGSDFRKDFVAAEAIFENAAASCQIEQMPAAAVVAAASPSVRSLPVVAPTAFVVVLHSHHLASTAAGVGHQMAFVAAGA